MKRGRTPCRRNGWITQNSYRPKPGNHLCHLNNCWSANCGWKKVRCKSAQTLCVKHYCDCWLFVSETFFYAKKRRQNSLLLPIFLDVENGHFRFCYRKRYKISPNRVFLMLHGMLKFQVIISGDNHCLVEILPLDLRSWRNWKVIVPMGTIFTFYLFRIGLEYFFSPVTHLSF